MPLICVLLNTYTSYIAVWCEVRLALSPSMVIGGCLQYSQTIHKDSGPVNFVRSSMNIHLKKN